MNYYNEFDPKAAAWLRQLIAEGLIPKGDVDERSIADVQPHELSKYTQCHFFAGIAGWSVALELAGWDASRPVWTGSCPCQPFSSAGKGLGTEDERHLWPVFAKLINACKPPVVFGEQVASKAGRAWLGGVFADLEAMAYRRAGADLCAAGVGADHIRQRLYWVADANLQRERSTEPYPEGKRDSVWVRQTDGLADSIGQQEQSADKRGFYSQSSRSGAFGGLEHTENLGPAHRDTGSSGEGKNAGSCRGWVEVGVRRSRDAWSSAQPILCRDGKYRRVPTEPALFPLADGLPFKLDGRGSSRPAILKGSGNAIVPQVAAEFIKAYLDTLTP